MARVEESLYLALTTCCRERQIELYDGRVMKASAIFDFPAAYSGFKGHFPGKPVLPAIVQLATVRFLTECVLECEVMPVSYRRIKFRGMIQPGDKVVVTIDFERSGKTWTGFFTLKRSNNESIASGSIGFILF